MTVGTEKPTYVVSCISCEKHVKATLEGQYEFFDDYEIEPVAFALLRCTVCNSPMLGRRGYFVDDDGEWMPFDPRVIYPEPYKQLGPEVPLNVRNSYEEAIKCLSVQSYVASSIMCRRTLEAVVHELLSATPSLAKGIEQLKAKGLIDPQLVEWANALRVSGNKAAHDVGEKVSKQDAQDILEFAHALIEYVFTYKRKFEEFKERAKQREEAAKKAAAKKASDAAAKKVTDEKASE